MLESLTIRNYAIIDEMTAGFTGGLNVITGETGAGKSIVVDALELVLGARADTSMIRAGEPVLEVSAVFSCDRTVLEGISGFTEDEGEIILRREVRADGNNRCYVNDRPVTLRTLKEIGDRLVDFHGQHDHQSLLVVSEHAGYLDGYGRLADCAEEVRRIFSGYVALGGRIAKLTAAMETAQRDRELYEFQIGEIDRAAPAPGEDDELDASIRRLSRAGELRSLGMRIFEELSEADGSVVQVIGGFAAELERMVEADNSLAPVVERMNALAEGAGDLALYFRGYADEVDDDPALLAECDERLAVIERLKKKYGPSLDDVLAYREKIARELEGAGRNDEELLALEKERTEKAALLREKALELSKRRKEAAPALAHEVEAHLAELGMAGSRLVVNIVPAESGECLGEDGLMVNENGCDHVEFLMSANPGEPPRPLVKVASGGEISRIMLSLKLALSGVNRVPSMVFDEIDVGVSGRIAEAIGRKLMKLTGNRQAIVITHLPQIAVMGDRHYSARKRIEGDRTLAGLVLLDEDMRQRELASLLSGETLTDTALAHARQLMDKHKRMEDGG